MASLTVSLSLSLSSLGRRVAAKRREATEQGPERGKKKSPPKR